jgi:hypothetical protein
MRKAGMQEKTRVGPSWFLGFLMVGILLLTTIGYAITERGILN